MIDFDASVSYRNKQYVGAKYSSAYCPPEMIELVKTDDSSTIFVRTYETDSSGVPIESDLPQSLLLAHPSYDMWSVGATLYQVLNNLNLSCIIMEHFLKTLIFALIAVLRRIIAFCKWRGQFRRRSASYSV